MSEMHVGQKVVCIDDYFDPDIAKLYTCLPTEKRVYVIRGMTEGVSLDDGNPKPGLVLYLVGLLNPVGNVSGKEHGFNSKRFRPLDEVKESMTNFSEVTERYAEAWKKELVNL